MTDFDGAARKQAVRLIHHFAIHPSVKSVSADDRRTSMADARIALCLAQGVAPEDIDPASGYDYSAEAYARVRESWRNLARQHGFSRFYDGPHYERAIAAWRARRPDLVVDNWIEEEWVRDF
uniref:hypothetical protein n=1 Tax=Nonomuraea sp. CA-251285 TaxID=3240002 RepID=UPI003F491FA7